jgi:glycosyltransferase involved in cell wall biosynthesis
MTAPSVSVVICTYNRAASLRVTLESLEWLAYPAFEVVVVAGPCTDHTTDVLAAYTGCLKVVHTADRNLSASRNLGIASAAGELIAFLDDDAIPDPRWLTELVSSFADPEVQAAGGPLLDHTGYRLQARYSLSTRWGDAWVEFEPRRLDHLQHPNSWRFPYVIGTNALFRRDPLIALGGFDENYVFYLDETDVCLRLIDRGWRVVPGDRGIVYHKFLPSGIRNEARVTVDRFNVVLSRAYFAIRHGLPRADETAMASAFAQFVKDQRTDLSFHAGAGHIPVQALEEFDRDVTVAANLARERAAAPALTRPPDWFDARSTTFQPFPTRHPSGRRPVRLCIVAEDDDPGAGSGRGAGSTVAIAMASGGNIAHYITTDPDHQNTVDFEHGVWVHRIRSSERQGSPPTLPDGPDDRIPSIIDEIRRVDDLLTVDVVLVPSRDDGAIVPMLEGRYRTSQYADVPARAASGVDGQLDFPEPGFGVLSQSERTGRR